MGVSSSKRTSSPSPNQVSAAAGGNSGSSMRKKILKAEMEKIPKKE